MGRARLVVVVALLAWMATACQVSLQAGVDVGRNGAGRVRAGVGLDADALKQVGDPATALRVDDLRKAGWEVEGPKKEDDGLTWVRASKPFTDPDQAGATMAALTGPGGPFRDLRLVRTKSRTRSRTTFTGTLDLSQGLSGLSDPELTGALGDVDIGLDVDGLRRRFGDDLARSVKVRFEAGLPGKVKTNAPGSSGGRPTWGPELGQTVAMVASSSAFRVDPLIPVGGGATVVVLVSLGVVGARRRRRRYR